MSFLGIDLGTTNSVIYTFERGVYKVVEVYGRRSTPSVVGWHPTSKELIVGAEAKKRILISPETIIVSNKRFMGDRDKRYSILGNEYSPVDIASVLLKYLIKGATETLGRNISKVVITVPAYFNQNQKEDTKKAAEMAGVEVLALQQEPTAAALAYGVDQGISQTILVYDLGGGTFDVSILEVEDNTFTVKGIGGDAFLGGDNFDEAIEEWFIEEIKQSLGVDLTTLKNKEAKLARQKLIELAEQAKIELSSSNKTDGYLPNLYENKTFEFELSRSQFKQLILSYLVRTTDIVRRTLKEAGLTKEDINRVICVGGATKSPLVRDILEQEIKTPFMAANVDEIVAKGAAVTALSLLSPTEVQTDAESSNKRPVKIVNVTPHDLGIRTENDQFSIIIPKQTPLPVTIEKTYSTHVDYADETIIEVFQGSHQLCSNNTPLGGFVFRGFQKAKAGVPRISIRLGLNEDDILEVSATDQLTDNSKQLSIEKTNAKPFVPKPTRKIDSIKIATSGIGCDDMGAVLDQMKIPWSTLKDKKFSSSAALRKYDIVFINCCAGGEAGRNKKALRDFVSQGGILYVSDLSAPQIEKAFPGYIEFGSGGVAPQRVKAEVVNEDIKAALGKNIVNIYFDLSAWVPITSVSDKTEIYLEAEVNCTDQGLKRRPIMAGFKYGEGYVVYTAFHNHSNPSREEMELLRVIALKPISVYANTPLVELNEMNTADSI